MVVVRESPRVHLSPENNDTQWPPKSPFAALMSSPKGRQRWQERSHGAHDRTPSPSPLRKPFSSSAALRALSQPSEDGEDEDEDEDDEETIQLRLAEIQAKLKIKELQRKAKKAAKDRGKQDDTATQSTRHTAARTDAPPAQAPSAQGGSSVQVPLSPTRASNVAVEHLSPARRKLGLQDVKKAEDVSLKRARSNPSRRAPAANKSDATSQPQSTSRALTFSERLAASRSEAQIEEAKHERIEKSRSTGFGDKSTSYSQAKTMIERKTRPDSSRQHLSKRPSSSHDVSNSNPTRAVPTTSNGSLATRTPRDVERLDGPSVGASMSKKGLAGHANDDELYPTNKADLETLPTSFDPYSEIHLSKRQISHVVVAREMENREIYTLPRLLKEVKAPHYDPPDCENDFVVFAILASKSSPFDQKAVHRTSDEHAPQEDATAPRNKFMVLKLCDLKWELDCFLFGTAFDQFWKLTPGTLLAILNPVIMPPKNNVHNGRFSLKLGSSEDCVMEIGVARDLGYCDSIKKDGQRCSEWVDKRSTEICEFHLNLLIDRERKGRMEVNTMFRGANSQDSKYRAKSRNLGEGAYDKDKKRTSHHPEYGRLYSVPSAVRNSAAKLMDNDDTDALHNMTREEASRKRIAAAQRERDLAKRLGEIGNGMGAEYLRVKNPPSKPAGDTRGSHLEGAQGMFDKPKASDLGLLDNKATDIHLSPAKDRKRHFGLGVSSMTTTAGGTKAMGWGGAKQAGLLQPKQSRLNSPEKGQTRLDSAIQPRAALVRERSSDGSLSPKKRARFALERGIREPGRESLGGDDLKAKAAQVTLSAAHDDDDDDDELDIV